jgi:hypothetical protein
MSRQVSPRRIALTSLLVFWLSVQSAVIGLSPAWGFLLPHSHITVGTMTEMDWQAHYRQHQFGAHVSAFYKANCEMSDAASGAVLASIPDAEGAISMLSVLSIALPNSHIEIPLLPTPRGSLLPQVFSAFERYDPPLHPPPNNSFCLNLSPLKISVVKWQEG